MFHLELRQFPHVARAFNLTGEDLEARFLGPWAMDKPLQFNDRRWSAEKTRLTIYEGPELRSEEMGLGRGWANVTRTGEDVTAKLMAQARAAAQAAAAQAAGEAAPAELKQAIVGCCEGAAVSFPDLVRVAGERFPGRRVSELVAMAEQSVWELLHEGQIRLVRADSGAVLGEDQWQPVLLAGETWLAAGDVLVAATG